MFFKVFFIFIVCVSLLGFPFVIWAQNSDETPVPVPTETPGNPGGSIEEPKPTPTPESTLLPTSAPTPGSAVVRTQAPSPSISSTPQPSVSSVSQEPISSPSPILQLNGSDTSSADEGFNFGAIVFAIPIIAGVAIAVSQLKKSKTKKPEKDSDRCNSIKNLLEQKKKELQEFVRSWPEEKLKEVATDKLRDELSKNETVGKVIDTAEKAKAHYDKLKETIETLEKRLDLCILSVPEHEGSSYQGTIIENSLNDKEILKNIEITKNYHMEDWLLNDVLVNKKQIEKLGSFLSDGPWYMHFWKEDSDDGIVVFKDKSFDIKFSDKSTWTEAINYGRSKGISEEQLDFKR